MRYDLIAPQAVLDALDAVAKSEGEHEHPVGALIAAEPRQGLAEADFLLTPPAAKTAEQFNGMVQAAIIAARKATLQTVGELDIALASETTGWSREVGSNAAQQALDQMSSGDGDGGESSSIEPGTFSAETFAQELRLRGFPSDIADSHAEALGALLDFDAPRPEGMSAVVEMRLDPQTQRLESAALYVGRRASGKVATAEIRWASVNGVATPQAEITLGYLH